LLKSYFDLKEFFIKTDEILGNIRQYKKIKSALSLYALGKFSASEVSAFFTNDYFIEIVGTEEINCLAEKFNKKSINVINDTLLMHIGNGYYKSSDIKRGTNRKLTLVTIKNKEYFYLDINSSKKIIVRQVNDIEFAKLENEARTYYNIALKDIKILELFVLARNLMVYFDYQVESQNKYNKENKEFFQKNGYLVINNFIG